MSGQIVDTVAIVLLDGKRFLVERRRKDDDSDPSFIAIPGGHVERGESFEEALKRETMEELGVTVTGEPINFCSELHTTTNGETNRIHYFRVDSWNGKIVSNEAESVYWESDPEVLSASADRKAIKRIL